MALKRQPLPILRDENAEIHRGKSAVAKAQQTDQCDRKTLSNITNRPKSTPLSGFATPSASRKGCIDVLRAGVENANGGFGFMVDPEFFPQGAKSETFTSAKKDRAVPRDPLRNISNVDLSQSSVKASEPNVKRKNPDPRAKNVKFGPNPAYPLTEEMKQKADAWAREGIERAHFTGKDMEALRAKMQEEEINKRVEQALSYRTDFPCFLPRAFEEDPPDIKDTFEFDVVDEFPQMASSLHQDEELWMPFVDYEESMLRCIEIMPHVSIDWPVIDDCIA